MDETLGIDKVSQKKIYDFKVKVTDELPQNDAEKLKKAIDRLAEATFGVKRSSGEDYLLHPIRVSNIALDEISLGTSTILAAIFHDALQDGYIKLDELENDYGQEVATMVDGLIKISTLYTEKLKLDSENFITLLLTVVSDVRIILLKLADRLDNIRNIKNFNESKQLKIAKETRLLYAPIAHRLGLYHIKSEFEDISLRHLEPEWYFKIANQLKDTKRKREAYIEKFSNPIKDLLKENKYKFEFKGRPKSVNSIYGKIKKKDIELSEIFDLFAIRIILDDVDLENERFACWNVYSLVTNIYKPNPTRLRDWITTPRSSGYESLHTTVIGPDDQWVEIQIRTRRMDEVAEKGDAAHWKYKESGSGKQHDNWLLNVRNVLENKNPDEIDELKSISEDKGQEDIFIFTPQGDIKKLKNGATILDLAYQIHTNLGDTCTGARVNEKIVPLKYKLKNGDTVEILSSKNQHPRAEWLNIAAFSRAKTKIRRSLSEIKHKHAEVGKEMLERKAKQLKINFTDQIILKIVNHFKYKRALDFYQDIADNKVDLQLIKEALTLLDEDSEVKPTSTSETSASDFVNYKAPSDDFLIIDETLANIDYKLAKCCRPIPGDDIFGFVTVDRGIQIHRRSCPNAPDLTSRFGYRIVPAKWTDEGKKSAFLVEIVVTGIDKMGIVSHISEVISKDHQVNMRSIALNTKDGIFQGFISVFVNNLSHLDTLLNNINKIKGVLKAERLDKA